MFFDKVALKKKLNDLSNDVENCEVKSNAWIWIILGAFTGLITSCIKFGIKTTTPIVAKRCKASKIMEEEI